MINFYQLRAPLVVLFSLLLVACGGGGGGGGASSVSPPTVDSSNWDAIVWDRDNWG